MNDQVNSQLQSLINNYKASNPQAPVSPSSSSGTDWYSQVKAGAYRPAGVDRQDTGLNFFQRSNEDAKKRSQGIAEAIVAPAQAVSRGASNTEVVRRLGESALRTAGGVAGGINDVIGEGAKTSAVNKLGHILSYLTPMPQPVQDLVSSLVSKAKDTETAHQIVRSFNDFATKHPDATKDLSSVANIALLAGGELIGGKAAPAVSDAVGDTKSAIVDTAKSVVGKSAKQSAEADLVSSVARSEAEHSGNRVISPQIQTAKSQQATWDLVKPNLSKSEQIAAVKSGKIASEGEAGTITQVPKGKDLEMVQASQPYVIEGKPIDTVSNMQKAVSDESAKLRGALKEQGGTWSSKNLKGVLNKISVDDPEFINIKSDSTNLNRFNNFKNAILKLAEDTPKTQEGKLDLRQGFDAITKKAFPKLWDTDSEMLPVVRAFRDSLNDFTEAGLPDGKLPDGTTFKESMRKQTLLLDAMDNVASKVEKVGADTVVPKIPEKVKPLKSPLRQTLDKHPIATKTVKAVARTVGLGAGIHLFP